MKFHRVHGKEISLTHDGRKAVKKEDTFCDGITFR
jgi:hypothetical protein